MQLTGKYKLKLFLLFMIAYALFYVYPNFFGERASQLPLLPIDTMVPFLPWTFILYTSDYFLILIVILMHDDLNQFNAMARMFFGSLFVCGAVFFLYPTQYPRPEYPVVESAIVQFWMNIVKYGDTPKNCLPSMHVAMTAVATWSLRSRNRGIFIFFIVWSLAIFASTLTTKQHYFVDIVAGIVVVVSVGLVESRLANWVMTKGKKIPLFNKYSGLFS